MAGWDSLKIIQTQAQIWAGLAIPGAGAGLVLDSSGEPDATANPLRKHLGHTSEGAEAFVKPTYNSFGSDESPVPHKRSVGDCEMAIAANLIQLEDMDIATLLLPGIATKSSPTGHTRVTFGIIPVTYSCIAIIWPRETDSTKFGYVMGYRMANDEGLAIQFGRTKQAGAPVSFKAHGITSRAATDIFGQYDIAN